MNLFYVRIDRDVSTVRKAYFLSVHGAHCYRATQWAHGRWECERWDARVRGWEPIRSKRTGLPKRWRTFAGVVEAMVRLAEPAIRRAAVHAAKRAES